MSIYIGADLVPTESNNDLFTQGNADELIGKELKELLDGADYRIFNLETPLADEATPILKGGPNLIAPTATIAGLKSIGVDLFSIANNHIMDQDVQGLDTTRRVISENGISYVGVGDNLEDAAKPYFFEVKGKRFGVYSCVEHEFSIATPEKSGANPFDPLESFDEIEEMKKKCDFAIVLYHGGKEHYRYPSPDVQKICRKFADKGADLIICQHSHCIGCEEKHANATIVYGQGNFLFDHSKKEFWQTGLLVRVEDDLSISYVPVVKTENKVRLAAGERAEEILDAFRTRSEEIKDPDFIQKKYAEFADTMIDAYLWRLSGKKTGYFYAGLRKLFGGRILRAYIDKKLNIKRIVAIENIIECEAHRELLLQGLNNKKANK